MGSIEVRIAGKGVVANEALTKDESIDARCGVCGQNCDLVVSLTADLYACRDCLRARLDASSVAAWRLREPSKAGLPWGSIAG
jgi:hypothetical protein